MNGQGSATVSFAPPPPAPPPRPGTAANEQYMLRLGRPTLEHRPDIQRSVVLIAEFEADYLDFIAPLKARRVAPPPLEEEDWEFRPSHPRLTARVGMLGGGVVSHHCGGGLQAKPQLANV